MSAGIMDIAMVKGEYYGGRMRKDPVRHHYIPKFLLRPFCCDKEKEYLMYYDRVSNTISKKSITDVFMSKNLYTDSINHPDKPVTIENKLAKFENEASQIISKFREEILKYGRESRSAFNVNANVKQGYLFD